MRSAIDAEEGQNPDQLSREQSLDKVIFQVNLNIPAQRSKGLIRVT